MKIIIKFICIITSCLFIFSCSNKNVSEKDNIDSRFNISSTQQFQVSDCKIENVKNKPLDLTKSYLNKQMNISFKKIPDFNKVEGIRKWKVPIDYYYRYPVSIPMVSDSNSIFYLLNLFEIADGYNVGNPGEKLYNTVAKFDIKTNMHKWVYKTEFPLYLSIANSDKSIFFGSDIKDREIGRDKNFITALDIMTGKERWNLPLKQEVPEEIMKSNGELDSILISGNIQCWNNKVYSLVNAEKYYDEKSINYFYLLCLDENKGKPDWFYIFPIEENFTYTTVLKLNNGKIYISNGDPKDSSECLLYVIDIEKKKINRFDGIMIQNLLIKNDDIFFLSDNNPNLMGFIENCSLSWSVGLNSISKDFTAAYENIYTLNNNIIFSTDNEIICIDSLKKDIS